MTDLHGATFRAAPGEVVNMTDAWPQHVSSTGFELVEGLSTTGQEEIFLVERPGPRAEARIPHDLYVKFWNLDAPLPHGDNHQVTRFARRYGYLRGGGQDHFHRKSDMLPQLGEPISYWAREIERFKDAMDLWNTIDDGPRAVIRKLDSLRAPFLEPAPGRQPVTYLSFPPSWTTTDPVEYADASLDETINRALGEHWNQTRCLVPECPDPEPRDDVFNVTRGQRRRGASGKRHLVIVSGTLIKTLWLQLAAYTTGLRTIKRCAAPDCRMGHLMDVTHTERPGAWTMHLECRERYKKRKKRLKLEGK